MPIIIYRFGLLCGYNYITSVTPTIATMYFELICSVFSFMIHGKWVFLAYVGFGLVMRCMSAYLVVRVCTYLVRIWKDMWCKSVRISCNTCRPFRGNVSIYNYIEGLVVRPQCLTQLLSLSYNYIRTAVEYLDDFVCVPFRCVSINTCQMSKSLIPRSVLPHGCSFHLGDHSCKVALTF